MSAPDLTTEVVGYRQWYVTPDLELRPAGYQHGGTWKRGTNTATCGRTKEVMKKPAPSDLYSGYESEYVPDPCGDTPGETCDCGFYALHDPSDHWYGKQGKGMFALAAVWNPSTDPLLSGIIVAWGALQVHHQGFRAQHARVAALALPESKRDQAVARAAARAYGVPCVPAEELPRIAAEYGGTVPAEYRPDKPKPKKAQGYTTSGGHLTSALFPGASFHSILSTTWGGSTWSIPLLSPPPTPSTPAPKVSRAARTRMEFIDGLKKPANRQGPDKPLRAPKNLGGAR